jgi:hypothetical protein
VPPRATDSLRSRLRSRTSFGSLLRSAPGRRRPPPSIGRTAGADSRAGVAQVVKPEYGLRDQVDDDGTADPGQIGLANDRRPALLDGDLNPVVSVPGDLDLRELVGRASVPRNEAKRSGGFT